MLSDLELMNMRETTDAMCRKYAPVKMPGGQVRAKAGAVDVRVMCDLVYDTLRELDETDRIVRHDASEKPKKRDYAICTKNNTKVEYSEYVLAAYHDHSFFEIVRYDFTEGIWINDEYRVIPVECWYELPKK